MSRVNLAFSILFVDDLDRAKAFYQRILVRPADLDVPGMVEFKLNPGASLGLMSTAGAGSILGEGVEVVAPIGQRGELYLVLDEVDGALASALEMGAELISGLALRPWGDRAAYLRDLDGHLLVLAEGPAR